MRNSILIAWATLVIAFAFSVVSGSVKPKPTPASLSEVVNEMKRSLQEAENATPSSFKLKLSSVTVELKTTVSTKFGGGLNLWIFSFGASEEKETASSVKIILGAPAKTRDTSALGLEKFDLTRAIVEAKRAYIAASDIDPTLSKHELTVDISFLVKRSVEGGVKIELIPIGIDIGGKYSKSHEHKLTLVFKNPTSMAAANTDTAQSMLSNGFLSKSLGELLRAEGSDPFQSEAEQERVLVAGTDVEGVELGGDCAAVVGVAEGVE
jgi:hypothetical protein